MLRGDIASLLFAHGKVACCKQKTLLEGRLKRLYGREPRLRILDLKDSKFGLYFAVSQGVDDSDDDDIDSDASTTRQDQH
jgi:hypothetical protein